MGGAPPPSDADRELADLRERAYGRHHDIEADPAALARLAELEEARGAARTAADVGAGHGAPPVAAVGEAERAAPDAAVAPVEAASTAARETSGARAQGDVRPSLWRRATATQASRIGLVAAGILALLAVVNGVRWVDATTPDATLRPLGTEGESRVVELLDAIGVAEDVSLTQRFETYRGVEPWSVAHSDGYVCLLAVDAARTQIFHGQCVPPGTDLYVNVGVWPSLSEPFAEDLPDGSIIRFHLREDAVRVFLYPAS